MTRLPNCSDGMCGGCEMCLLRQGWDADEARACGAGIPVLVEEDVFDDDDDDFGDGVFDAYEERYQRAAVRYGCDSKL